MPFFIFALLQVICWQINHFPGSFQLGRKDRLWRNISRMQVNAILELKVTGTILDVTHAL